MDNLIYNKTIIKKGSTLTNLKYLQRKFVYIFFVFIVFRNIKKLEKFNTFTRKNQGNSTQEKFRKYYLTIF